MRRRTRRIPPFLLLLFLPLVVSAQDDNNEELTPFVMLNGTEETPAVIEALLLSNETEVMDDGNEHNDTNLAEEPYENTSNTKENGSLPVGDVDTETTTLFSVPDQENVTAAVILEVTEAVSEMAEGVTEPSNVNVTEVEGMAADSNYMTTGVNEVTTEVMTAQPEPVPSLTKAPMTNTTAALKCGIHAKAVGGTCECEADWVRDPDIPSVSSCLCPNICEKDDQPPCPAGTQCYHVTCNVVSCKCAEEGKYYDPVSRTCLDACGYFGNILCGLETNKRCQSSDVTDVGCSCSCSEGFHLKNDTCADIDECSENNPCDKTEACLNTIGSHKCVCKEGYLRTSSGTCSNINECMNPHLNICEHLCEDQTPGYTCHCHQGYVIDDETKKCRLEDPATSCECSDPPKSICYQPKGGQMQCHPKPGYQLVNGIYEDRKECVQNVQEWCGVNGKCVEGKGSSRCRCKDGYTNNSADGECVAIECPVGTVLSGSSCVDPCSLVKCLYPMHCMVKEEGKGECVCGILCQGLMDPAGISSSVYSGTLVALSSPSEEHVIASKVTNTLSIFFGKGNTEVMKVSLQSKRKPRSTDSVVDAVVEFVVSTEEPNMSQEVKDVIRKQCVSDVKLPGGDCVLPGNIVVRENTIIVEVKDPCKDNPCPGHFFKCIPRSNVSGRYLCNCMSGFTKVEVRGGLGFCEDIDECNSTRRKRCKGDQECLNTPGSFVCREPPGKLVHDGTMKDIAVTFGILFAATLLIAIGLGYLLMKRSHRVREMVPMTETNTGFENHAFHK